MTLRTTGEGAETRLASTRHDNIACPFCGLLCDDVSIESTAGGVRVVANGCEKSRAGFERPLPAARPQVDGRDVDLAEAVAAAARLIRGANLPLFGGLGTDVEGARAVMALADRAGGVVDHALSPAMYHNYRVLQSTGWILTTLTEARNRADLFIVFGRNVHRLNPRFFERVVSTPESMFSDAPAKRTVVFVGDGFDSTVAAGPRVGDVIELPCPMAQVGEVAAALRAELAGRPVAAPTVAGLPIAAIRDLAERCRKSAYGVVVWAAADFDFADGDLTVQQLCDLVKDINKTARFAGLPLGGNEGSTSAASVCAWQSGYPLRVSFATGKPLYDPERYAIGRMLADGQGDVLTWIASFTPDLAPPATRLPMILLATPGLRPPQTPAVYIPVGTPGADHAGCAVRCDSVVSLPLRNVGRADLPRAADVLAAIEQAL